MIWKKSTALCVCVHVSVFVSLPLPFWYQYMPLAQAHQAHARSVKFSAAAIYLAESW